MEGTAFKFLNPAWLLLLPVVWWSLWVFAGRYRARSMWRRVCDPHLLERMSGQTPASVRKQWPVWALIALVTLGIIALAGPSWRTQTHPLMHSTAARVVVLSLSRSMLVEDVKPTRFDQAAAVAREIIAADFDGETGLVVFAGAAFVVSPLSDDAGTLLAFLESLSPEIMPVDGARVDLAITAAQGLLEASVAGKGQMLIIADVADDIDAATRAALEAGDRGHSVTVLAVGTTEGGPLRDAKGGLVRNAQGSYKMSRTRYADLERIARVGNGSLIRVSRNVGVIGHLPPALDPNTHLAAERVPDAIDRPAANDGAWLVWLMLPFALLLFRKNVLWALVLTLCLPGDNELYAYDWETFWRHAERRAFEAYRQGRYELAIELSRDPLLIGSAYYRMDRYQPAVEYFHQDHSAASLYNRGNAYARQLMFPEAVRSYDAALVLDPQLESAAYNKRLIELYMQQDETGSNRSDDENGEDGESPADEAELGDTQPQPGEDGQGPGTPGESRDSGAGLGVQGQPGLPDPSESFDPDQQQLQELILNAASDREFLDPAVIERWLKTLPESSSDLFRRKFLRDYQLQNQQHR